MAIYATFGKLQGSVTAEGFKDHIECTSFTFSGGRHVSMEVGTGQDREGTKPYVTEFVLCKTLDKSSPHMWLGSLVGKAIDKVEIKCIKTAEDDLEQYLSYTLEEVLVSNYDISSDNGTDGFEAVNLAYNKIEMKYHPRMNDNTLGSAIPAGYDVKTGKKL